MVSSDEKVKEGEDKLHGECEGESRRSSGLNRFENRFENRFDRFFWRMEMLEKQVNSSIWKRFWKLEKQKNNSFLTEKAFRGSLSKRIYTWFIYRYTNKCRALSVVPHN